MVLLYLKKITPLHSASAPHSLSQLIGLGTAVTCIVKTSSFIGGCLDGEGFGGHTWARWKWVMVLISDVWGRAW